MGEPVKKPDKREDLDKKVLTHPDLQRARDLASPSSSGFYDAISAAEQSYHDLEIEKKILEREKRELERELKIAKAKNKVLSEVLRDPKSLEIPTPTDLPTDDFIDNSLAKLEVVLELEDLRKKLVEERQTRKRYQSEVERLQPLAIIDGLTEAYNHRYFMDQIYTEIYRSIRKERPLTLLFMDIDDFTDFNNTYGHQAGDYVLKELSRIARIVLRETDIFARYGGEEFAAIMPDTTEEKAEYAAERLRKTIENTELEYKGEKLNFTVSIGVAPMRSTESDDLITDADKLMYLGKALGKNCVVSRSFAEDELGVDLSKYSGKKS
jgi:diguanylate cyclase